jgi:hypothetical protein
MNTRFRATTIFVCAVISGVLNYSGLSEMVTNREFFQLALCAATGLGVTLAITLFWDYAFAIVPDLKSSERRAQSWATIVAGIVLILAISSWWNVVGIGQDQISRLNAETVAVETERALAESIGDSGGYGSAQGDIAAFKEDISAIIEAESSGATSGAPGDGPISLTMRQIESRLDNLLTSIGTSSTQLGQIRSRGDVCLEALNKAVLSGNRDSITSAVSCANGVIADLGNQDILSQMERGLSGLTSGIVLPATIRTNAQRAVLTEFFASTQSRADDLVTRLQALPEVTIPPVSAEMPNLLMGVLLHWKSLIPVIATAISLDLLPLVILILTVLRKDETREEEKVRDHWTAEELMEAAALMKELRGSITPPADLPPPFVDLDQSEWDADKAET